MPGARGRPEGRREGGDPRARARRSRKPANRWTRRSSGDWPIACGTWPATSPTPSSTRRSPRSSAGRSVVLPRDPPSYFGPTVEALGAAGLTTGARVDREALRRGPGVGDGAEPPHPPRARGGSGVSHRPLPGEGAGPGHRAGFANEILEPIWNRYHVSTVRSTWPRTSTSPTGAASTTPARSATSSRTICSRSSRW